MIYTELTCRAMNIAYDAHHGQKDVNGVPYIFHPYHIAEQMPDETTTCVALLHDVVEDTDITMEELAKDFPPEVIASASCERNVSLLEKSSSIRCMRLSVRNSSEVVLRTADHVSKPRFNASATIKPPINPPAPVTRILFAISLT